MAPRLARVHGQTSPMLVVAALIGSSGGWRAGGAGYFSLEQVSLGVPPPLPNLELHVGYGGVLIERSFHLGGEAADGRRSTGLLTRLLIGGGNAAVRDSATGTRLRSDNFLALEPAIGFRAPLSPWAAAGVIGAYRIVVGVDGLQDIEEEDLGGASIGLAIILGPF